MLNNDNTMDFVLNIVIARFGLGSKVISLAKENGITGGTILLGKGTVRNSLLKFLELAECNREVILVLSKRNLSCRFLETVSTSLKFHKPNHGICFSIPVMQVYGTHITKNSTKPCERNDPEVKDYNSIFVIVDKGNAETVVEAATKVGAKGATIVNGRGSGIHETSRIFSIEIEPEKEIVLILVEKEITEKVCDSIKDATDLDQPGRGILFVQNVAETYGIIN
jgi:nitrogen regulatory protein PII